MFHLVIYYDFSENKTLVVHSQKIYNVVAKIKRNRIQGRNTIEEVLCLRAERGYTVFHRNREDNNVLSDIVVAQPTSIGMIRTWPYVLIMDTAYKTNKTSQWQQLLCAMNRQRYTDGFFNKSSTYILHLLCQMVRGLDLSSVSFWDRDNEPGRERTFCVEVVAINVSR
ncbi:hypothetical protein M9H77_26497 [Catharanthus roseus]|uniref:Uncharacterized protein n=1 Tax=Catharanthus roseus TaxID=4058 RepID=A0ACC0AC10_CATRO|nr:hypothetical protein M9H77_26497 [Catharanthus roseus]